jgi:hypothetical protein
MNSLFIASFHDLESWRDLCSQFAIMLHRADPKKHSSIWKNSIFGQCRISDFYLFGTVNGRLRGRTFQDPREPLEAISEMPFLSGLGAPLGARKHRKSLVRVKILDWYFRTGLINDKPNIVQQFKIFRTLRIPLDDLINSHNRALAGVAHSGHAIWNVRSIQGEDNTISWPMIW